MQQELPGQAPLSSPSAQKDCWRSSFNYEADRTFSQGQKVSFPCFLFGPSFQTNWEAFLRINLVLPRFFYCNFGSCGWIRYFFIDFCSVAVIRRIDVAIVAWRGNFFTSMSTPIRAVTSKKEGTLSDKDCTRFLDEDKWRGEYPIRRGFEGIRSKDKEFFLPRGISCVGLAGWGSWRYLDVNFSQKWSFEDCSLCTWLRELRNQALG